MYSEIEGKKHEQVNVDEFSEKKNRKLLGYKIKKQNRNYTPEDVQKMSVFFVYEQEESFMLTHFIAFCAGGFVGVLTTCMCIAAGEADRRNKNPQLHLGTAARV
ncbi:MAG: DUF3789 domain-containing protein [Lachnospiraceae bacterium]|nr:DUF3789 domain-containing protein [Lachnospiraceae bacterium]